MKARCLSLLLLLAACLLQGCDAPDYPADWPRPVSGGMLASKKGDCPDLTGAYDGVNADLDWLLGSNPDVEKSVPHWFEHRAIITQAEDGSWLKIGLTLNEKGLPAYRDHLLLYNNESNGFMAHKDLWLTAGKEYTCRNGWLYSERFAQPERVHTWQRKSLQLGKDSSGALIAGATINKEIYLSVWAESQGTRIGAADDTRWYRWPARPAQADALLEQVQSVTVHRYKWINHGRRIPVRFTSFYVEPICVRLFYGDHPVKVHGPLVRRGRDDPRPEEQDCTDGWGRFDIGEVFRKEVYLPDIVQEDIRIEWYRMNAADKTPQVIRIGDVRELPLMPEQTGRKKPSAEETGQASH